MMFSRLCVLLGVFHISFLSAQEPVTKFGQVSAADFLPTAYGVDSSAAAVILSDIGSTKVVDNTKGGFRLEFKHFRRARILKKNGYDLADVSILVYTEKDGGEELKNLKAVLIISKTGRLSKQNLTRSLRCLKTGLIKTGSPGNSLFQTSGRERSLNTNTGS